MNVIDPIELGRRVRELRQVRGWKQVDLQRAALTYVPEGRSLSRVTISHVENGTNKQPDLWTIAAIAGALEMPIDNLLYGRPIATSDIETLHSDLFALLDFLNRQPEPLRVLTIEILRVVNNYAQALHDEITRQRV